MATVPDKMKSKVSLHGLGFIQLQLQDEQRIHVWHPDLPRRSCYEHSAIHNHRFGFISRILVGSMINVRYEPRFDERGSHLLYSHEGPRGPGGGRPWEPAGRVYFKQTSYVQYHPGDNYSMEGYDYHQTLPQGDGRVATLLRKLGEGEKGACSSCLVGVAPDAEFDRHQCTEDELWQIVREVLTLD